MFLVKNARWKIFSWLHANMFPCNICESVWADRNIRSVRHKFQCRNYSLYMSQQYSLQEALPGATNLKNIALPSHASFMESLKKNLWCFLNWVSPSNISNVYVLHIRRSLKQVISKEVLKSVTESHLVFPNFHLLMNKNKTHVDSGRANVGLKK